MAEPHSVAIGALYGAGLSPIALLIGAQPNALVAGLIAAFLVSIWLDTIDNKIKATAAVLFSALLAGYGSPSAAELVTATLPGIPNTDSLRVFMALMIGAGAPSVVPILIRAWAKKAKGGQP